MLMISSYHWAIIGGPAHMDNQSASYLFNVCHSATGEEKVGHGEFCIDILGMHGMNEKANARSLLLLMIAEVKDGEELQLHMQLKRVGRDMAVEDDAYKSDRQKAQERLERSNLDWHDIRNHAIDSAMLAIDEPEPAPNVPRMVPVWDLLDYSKSDCYV